MPRDVVRIGNCQPSPLASRMRIFASVEKSPSNMACQYQSRADWSGGVSVSPSLRRSGRRAQIPRALDRIAEAGIVIGPPPDADAGLLETSGLKQAELKQVGLQTWSIRFQTGGSGQH